MCQAGVSNPRPSDISSYFIDWTLIALGQSEAFPPLFTSCIASHYLATLQGWNLGMKGQSECPLPLTIPGPFGSQIVTRSLLYWVTRFVFIPELPIHGRGRPRGLSSLSHWNSLSYCLRLSESAFSSLIASYSVSHEASSPSHVSSHTDRFSVTKSC